MASKKNRAARQGRQPPQVQEEDEPLITEKVDYVDYKDVDLLTRFMSDRAKIRNRRVTGNDVQQQRDIANAIKVAREMAPAAVRQARRVGEPQRPPATVMAAAVGERDADADADARRSPSRRSTSVDATDEAIDADDVESPTPTRRPER